MRDFIHEELERERSAREAASTVLEAADLERYLNPSPDTIYPLEYAFYLLGDIAKRRVVDLGCGSGENLIPLAVRGANVVGIDLSPDLIDLAQRRLQSCAVKIELCVASAYSTGLPDESVDVVFAQAIFHHIDDLARVRREVQRILRPGGCLILQEPIRFSPTMRLLRRAFPRRDAIISAHEHPMTRAELNTISAGFELVTERRFRLPYLHFIRGKNAWRASDWMLRRLPPCRRWATIVVRKLVRP